MVQIIIFNVIFKGLQPGYGYWVGGSRNAENQFLWLDEQPMQLGVPFWGTVGTFLEFNFI